MLLSKFFSGDIITPPIIKATKAMIISADIIKYGMRLSFAHLGQILIL